jgi:hypothetical protein
MCAVELARMGSLGGGGGGTVQQCDGHSGGLIWSESEQPSACHLTSVGLIVK